MKTRAFLAGVLLAGLAFARPALAQDEDQAPAQTIRNLREMAQGEANAANRYDLFAERAEQEGFPEVAELFRAAATSERIHRRNHEAVLEQLGVPPPQVVIEEVEVGTTHENLLQPIAGEREEATRTYPGYIRQAEKAGVPAAALSFRYAAEAEAGHERLFRQALDQLGSNPDADYLVESESGILTTVLPGKTRPVTAP